MKINCLESILIPSLGALKYERHANTSASCVITAAFRLVPFPNIHRCSPLHRLIRIATEALKEIPGLVPSNPRRNTSGTLFELQWSGDNVDTCCRFVAPMSPHFPLLNAEVDTQRRQSGDMLPLFLAPCCENRKE